MKKIVVKQKVDEITISELLGGNFSDKIIFYRASGTKYPMFLKILNPSSPTHEHNYGFISPILGNSAAFTRNTLVGSIEDAMKSRQVYVISRDEWPELLNLV